MKFGRRAVFQYNRVEKAKRRFLKMDQAGKLRPGSKK
jgi:hypothetical protein